MKMRLGDIKNTEPKRDHGDIGGVKATIESVGLISLLAVDEAGNILAGRRRYQALMELYGPDYEIEVNVLPTNGDPLRPFAISLAENIQRKNLSDLEEAIQVKEHDERRRRLQGEKRPGGAGGVHQTLVDGQGWTQERTAQDLSISQQTVSRAIEIAKTVDRHPELASLPSGTAILREAAKLERRDTPLPQGLFDVIVADPPWPYRNSIWSWGPAELHYPSMSLEEICALEVPAAPDSALFLWATNPCLREAFQVVDAWGFEYKTNVVWVKTNRHRPGAGFYVRGWHELLLVCTRGSFVPCQVGREPLGSVIEADVGEHSAKPREAYELIERIYPDAHGYLELFARNRRPNWTAWGEGLADPPGGPGGDKDG